MVEKNNSSTLPFKLEIEPSTKINDAISSAIKLATEANAPVEFKFNCIKLVVDKDSDLKKVQSAYEESLSRFCDDQMGEGLKHLNRYKKTLVTKRKDVTKSDGTSNGMV